jgi:hypothetical protein
MHPDKDVQKTSSLSMEEAIEVADIRADRLGIKIVD